MSTKEKNYRVTVRCVLDESHADHEILVTTVDDAHGAMHAALRKFHESFGGGYDAVYPVYLDGLKIPVDQRVHGGAFRGSGSF